MMSAPPPAVPALHYIRRGSGAPLVLLHGIGGELCVWEPVIPALAAVRDVIAIDLPGFGASPALVDVEPTPVALAAAVAQTLGALGLPRVHVAGNSLGAWIALELARAGHAHSVVGICPAGLWRAPLITGSSSRRGSARHVVRGLGPALHVALRSRRVRSAVLATFTAHPERVPYEAAWRMVHSYGRATAYAQTNVAMRRSYFRDPQDITVPVTLAFGERDRLVARVDIPGYTTIALPDCGHIPMWDNPELITEVLLAGSSAKAGSGRRRAAAGD
jgi:pimeloyl-ACP methyl ester carboxylesterase